MEPASDAPILKRPSVDVEVFMQNLIVWQHACLDETGGIDLLLYRTRLVDFVSQNRLLDFTHDTACSQICYFDFGHAKGSGLFRPKPHRAMRHGGRTNWNDQSRAEFLGTWPIGHHRDIRQ